LCTLLIPHFLYPGFETFLSLLFENEFFEIKLKNSLKLNWNQILWKRI